MMLGTPVAVFDASVTLTGGVDTALTNDGTATRSFLMIQAPAGSSVTFSFTNSSVAANATGCFTLAGASAPVIFPGPVPQGPLYLKGTNAAVCAIIVGYGGS